jgi:hypothetical protein
MARKRGAPKSGLQTALGITFGAVGVGLVGAALLAGRRAQAATTLKPVESGAEVALTIDGLTVYRSGSILWWKNGDLSLDYDGAPNAYAPPGFGHPLDHLANAGRPGAWAGIDTDGPHGSGQPLVQGPGEPFPGYYISTTALHWPHQKRTDQHVDSRQISYIALPPVFLRELGARLGDLALVESTQTGRKRWAIFADVGPTKKLGEGSLQLARSLGVEASALRRTGINVSLYVGSGDGQPHPEEEIQRRGELRTRLVA